MFFLREMIDPFIYQFILAPLITITIGVIVAIKFKKIYLGVLTTLIINILLEAYFYGFIDIFSIYNFAFPIITIIISIIIVKRVK
ncbi:hypothetical protein [uncultured Clostridium sp.]|uniref:hypothetical protein n=1 Tax=uncultured Clostridium sp. TaxID=59620 RepID=UPI0032170FC2